MATTNKETVSETVVKEAPKKHGIVAHANLLNVRSKGSVDSEVIDVITEGTEVEIVRLGKEFSKVSYGNKTGYCMTKFIDVK